MTVRTTKIDLRGDRVQAEKIRLGHLERLLYNFRRNNEFQKLDVSAAQHNIYTDTGEFLGEVILKTVHGAEMVTVNAPPGKKEVQKEEKKVIVEETMQSIVVPVFPSRTADNGKTYFVACLSGTFEGPYYVFENLSEFNTTTDLDDLSGPANAEGKWLSTGPSPIFNSDDPPQLFFVSQSGQDVVVEGETEVGNTSQEVNFVDWAVEADCPGSGLIGTLQFQTDIANYRRTPISLGGVRFSEFDEDYTTVYDVERHVYFASGTMDDLLKNLEGGIQIFLDSGSLYSTAWTYPYETTKLMLKVLASGSAGTAIRATSMVTSTGELAALIEELPGGTFTDESETIAIFPDQEAFCTAFAEYEYSALRILSDDYVTHILAAPWPTTEKFLYLNGARHDISEYADGGMATGNIIKYYAEGNLATGTVLADTNNTGKEDHYFHYIGPYSDNALTTTQFKGAGNFNVYFEIPDIPVPEGTVFRDTFFMGQIQYTSTEEVVVG